VKATARLDVRFGSKADMCSATAHVRSSPESDRKSGHNGTSFAPHCSVAAISTGVPIGTQELQPRRL